MDTPPTNPPQTQSGNGQTVTETQPQVGHNKSKNMAETIPASPAPKKKSPKILIAGLILVLIMALLGGAYFYLQNQKTKNPELSHIQTQDQPSPTPDPTEGWKTYQNTEYGFKLEYPQDWYYKEVSWDGGSGETTVDYDGIKLKPNESTGGNTLINVYLVKNQGLNIRDYFNINDYSCCGMNVTKNYLGDKIMSSETTVVDGVEARVLMNAPEDIIVGGVTANWIVVETNGKIYLLSYHLDQEETAVDVVKVFDQIVSTFKFTNNPDPTATDGNQKEGWTEYNNSGGYSYSYPSAWTNFEYFRQSFVQMNPNQGYSNFSVIYDPVSSYDRKLDAIRKSSWSEVKESNTTLNGYNCISLIGTVSADKTEYQRKYYLLKDKVYVYEVDIWEPATNDQMAISNQILSTFKFIDSGN